MTDDTNPGKLKANPRLQLSELPEEEKYAGLVVSFR